MKNKSAPYVPPKWEEKHAGALQALARGDASEHQQKLALDFIITDLCATYDLSYRPESERDSAFAEGKRFVGLQIVKLIKVNLSTIRKAMNDRRKD